MRAMRWQRPRHRHRRACRPLGRLPAMLGHRAQGRHTVSGEVHAHEPNADVIRRVDAIADHVEHLVEELVQLKSALVEVDLMPWLSYRLAVVLSRVDHAAAEIVIQQAARTEAEAIAGCGEPSPASESGERLTCSRSRGHAGMHSRTLGDRVDSGAA